MSDILAEHLRPSRDAVESAVGDETVILHLKSGTYFGLDPVGTRIWALLKEGLTPAELCQQIASEYEIEPAIIEADARRFLGELKANGIVEDA